MTAIPFFYCALREEATAHKTMRSFVTCRGAFLFRRTGGALERCSPALRSRKLRTTESEILSAEDDGSAVGFKRPYKPSENARTIARKRTGTDAGVITTADDKTPLIEEAAKYGMRKGSYNRRGGVGERRILLRSPSARGFTYAHP